jgi:clorobiocin biosynthesis protein CloN7
MPGTAASHKAVSHTLEVPGARLYYEVRGSGPLLMLIGLPIDSTGFTAIAPLLADEFTVVTYDPRGFSNSTIDDPEQDATPELIAEDVHRVIAALDVGPAQMFGSSGGAVTGLALVSRHPEQVRTLVAHEPPLAELLPEPARLRSEIQDVYDTYRSHGQGPAWAKFMACAGFAAPSADGPPADDAPAQSPAPPPPTAQEVANGDRMLGHGVRPITGYLPDLPALCAAPTRIVVANGAASAGQLAHRAAAALAAQFGTSVAEFPGGHIGFLEEPEQFAKALRRVLADVG